MGTVKYTGPVASFHCPTNAEIRSLKVHFSPKQEGTGDPSPENVREIVGWDGVDLYKAGRNLLDTSKKYQASSTQVTIGQDVGRDTFKIFLKAGTYTITTLTSISASVYIARKSLTGTSTKIGNTNKSNTFTIDSDDWCELFVYKSGTGITVNDIISFQLEYNFTVTSYEPYKGSITNYEFGVLGKNKWDEEWEQGALDSSTGNIATSAVQIRSKNYIPVVAGETYYGYCGTLSGQIAGSLAIIYYDADHNFVQYGGGINGKTKTIPDGVSYIKFWTGTAYGGTYLNDIAINYPSTTTTYEPYNPNHTVYGGWVDLITGEVCEEYTLLHFIKNYFINVSTSNGATCAISATIGAAASTNRFYCNHLNSTRVYASNETITANPYDGWISGEKRLVFVLPQEITTLEQVQDLVDNLGGLDVVYKRETPRTYSLAPTQLQTFLGQNNVWSNADYVEVEYDLHETQDILARKQFIMANQPHIVKPAAAPLQNFVTDVPAPLKECKVYFEPKQDLHGYSNPWSAGGGKNIAKPYDNSYVSSTYVSFDYSASTGTFHCSGSASASSSHSSPSASNAISNNATFTLPAGTYTLSIIDGDGTYIYAQCVSSTETVLAETTSHISFTTNEALTVFVRLKVAAGGTVDNTVKIQLEAGSAATSYVPYENICPIEGWDGINVLHTGKNLLNINECYLTNMSQSNGVFTNTAVDTRSSVNFTLREQYGINANQSTRECFYVIPTTGKFVQNFTINNDDTIYLLLKHNGASRDLRMVFKWTAGTGNFRFMADIDSANPTVVGGFTLHNIQIIKLDDNNDYEPYNGTTIPITFPATKNLFDETYENISGNVTYKSLYVGNNAVTASSDMPLATNSYSNLFILPGQVTSGASTGENDFNLGKTRTVTPIDGYVTIGYRNNYDIDPRNYHAQIERGSVATAYEPYGTVYGGYVDLVTGEVVVEQTKRSVTAFTGIVANHGNPNGNVFYLQTFITSIRNQTQISNRFIRSTLNYSTMPLYSFSGTWGATDYVYFVLPASVQTLEDANAWLNDNPTEFIYELTTPIIYSLTSQILKTLRGTNNVWSNANGNIDLSYWKH